MFKCFPVPWSPGHWLLVSYMYVLCPGVMKSTVSYQSQRPSCKQTNKRSNTRADGTALPEVV